MPNPFYLCAGLCTPRHWWNSITQQQVKKQQMWEEKQKGIDGQWYGGTEGTCNNLMYFFTSSASKLWKEHPPQTQRSIHVYAKSWVNFTQTCVFIIQTNYAAQKEVWSLWTEWLNSQLRLTRTKDLRQGFMWSQIWSSKCFSHTISLKFYKKNLALTEFQRRWMRKSQQLITQRHIFSEV